MDLLYPTRNVPHGSGPVHPLTSGPEIAPRYTIDDEHCDVDRFMQRNDITGLLVLKGDRIALEKYAQGNSQRTRWTSFSVAKSISSTLVAAALHDGAIRSPLDPVTHYVPQLIGSGYDGVTVEQVLNMTSGVRWDETYRNPQSDRRAMFSAQLALEHGGILKVLAALPRLHAPGTVFNYSTGESFLQAEIVRAATGMPVATYLSQKIWQPMGMEQNAFWQLDSEGGLEIASSGFGAVLRDYGRFGRFIANGGKIGDGQVLPVGWVDDIVRLPAVSPLRDVKPYAGPHALSYHHQWWLFPQGEQAMAGHGARAFSAIGVFGQYLYIDRDADVVVVLWSSAPAPEMPAYEREIVAFIAASVESF
ncbi:beta-lactamase family protein [Diaphorobacter sp. HDW4A]|nr:beta-lactamase family protein [Diaphorobacter sp. HDW4A]